MKSDSHNAMSRKGFTLVELLVATAMFGLIMSGAIGVYIMCQDMWQRTSLSMAISRSGNLALSRLVYGVGTNNGLRTASSISVTNMQGNWDGPDYVYPPAPGDKHFLNSGVSDGSWRMTVSNAFDGRRCVDFNKVASNIVEWAAPTNGLGDPGSDPEQAVRQLICNYVSNAEVSVAASGVGIKLIISQSKGRYTTNKTFSTFIKRRN